VPTPKSLYTARNIFKTSGDYHGCPRKKVSVSLGNTIGARVKAKKAAGKRRAAAAKVAAAK
jgi:hypothetical protein